MLRFLLLLLLFSYSISKVIKCNYNDTHIFSFHYNKIDTIRRIKMNKCENNVSLILTPADIDKCDYIGYIFLKNKMNTNHVIMLNEKHIIWDSMKTNYSTEIWNTLSELFKQLHF